MKLNRCAVAALMMLACPSVGLAETLTTSQVVALSTSGIGDAAIIAKIKSSGTRMDLSTDQMISLKKQGVSGPVLAALMGGGVDAAPQFSVDSPDPMVPHPTGVYLLSGANGASMERIDATVSNQAKTGGIWGYALTGGIASVSVKAAIQNETARVKTPAGTPTFYFFFDESNPATANRVSALSAGDATVVTSPSEFTLVRLTKKDGRREARVGSMNIGGAKSGVMDKDRLAFTYQVVRPGVYRVTPSEKLGAGEYGFIYALQGGGGRGIGMMTARVFDFSVS